ncbi:GPO family capsid scaffolding protein [Photobacterium iliopiscarium]|jgi:hypothetical protein|uniref:Capsid scaffolding protein n=1 Tax=Photobacterium iliopiscarium TaxID=56192 RepID=A0ABX5GXM4_9GAMM|nr:GPO family capsid scaffolding protein [Photobacterium iliopiscarium]PSW99586.1 capsid scaffolding protein [Photobacterium iliopiscarium]
MPLQSGFIVIATSGKTVDDRKIEASWLEEAAANYDPTLYTAVLDLNHWDTRWAGTYGTVIALDCTKDKEGIVTLRGNLEPNEALIAMSKQEVLFTSVSLQPDFRGTGQHYLIGLAVTPKPASVGTEQLKFSCDTTDQDIHTDYVQVDMTFSEHKSDKSPNFLQKLFSKTTPDPLENIMSKLTEERLLKAVESMEQFSKGAPPEKEILTKTEAQALLEAQGYSVIKQPTANDLTDAQSLLEKHGFSIEKTATNEEITAAKELLKAQGFSIEKTPEDKGKPDGEEGKTGGKITREQFAMLAKEFADASVTEFDFTVSADQVGGDDDLAYV